MQLSPILLSENLLAQIQQNPILEIVGPAASIDFDSDGNLVDMLGDRELQAAH